MLVVTMPLLVAAVLAFLVAPGCSFSARVPPPNYAPETHGYPDCDRDVAGRQFADGLGAGLTISPAVIAGMLAIGDRLEDDDARATGPLIAATTVLSTVFFASIRSGFRKTAKCESAHVRYEAWKGRRNTR